MLAQRILNAALNNKIYVRIISSSILTQDRDHSKVLKGMHKKIIVM